MKIEGPNGQYLELRCDGSVFAMYLVNPETGHDTLIGELSLVSDFLLLKFPGVDGINAACTIVAPWAGPASMIINKEQVRLVVGNRYEIMAVVRQAS